MKQYNHLESPRDLGPEFDGGELPDLFLPPGFARRISSRDEWPAARKAWLDVVLDIGYGGLPPACENVEIEHLCTSSLKTWLGSPMLVSMRIHCRGGLVPFSLRARLLHPPGMVRAVDAARAAYRFLGVPETRCSFHIRAGAHRHDPEDWDVLRDFLRWQWSADGPSKSQELS